MTTRPTPATDMRTLSDLTLDPRNANRGTPRGREALRHSLHAFGAGRAVLIDRHGVVMAGNKTVAEARAQGLRLRVIESDGSELIAVQRRDLDLASDDRAQALALADNRVGELDLVWDETTLQELHAAGVELADVLDRRGAGRAVRRARPRASTDENAVLAPGPTAFRRGHLIALGRHRLLCGDATASADVARVLAGETPRLLVSDPPYGVDYTPAWRHDVYPGQRTAVGRVVNDDRADWTDAWRLFTGDVAYVFHAGLRAATVAASLEAAGFDLRSQIIWVKQQFALSRGHYHWGHEPAWYAVRRGATARWCGDRQQSTIWEVPNLNPVGGLREGENAPTGHGTQKPVRLVEIPLLNHTQPGETLFDPFCGSGTALIAAEKTGRRCVALEIDPQYVQVAVSRWEAFTGQSATVVGGGR